MQRSEYSAFGVLVGRTTASSFDDIGGQPFGFAGGLFDPVTGLTRFGARDYDPRLGRWLTRDPLGFGAGDTNLFAYVGGDPVNLVDPAGAFAHLAAEFAVEFAMDAASQYMSKGCVDVGEAVMNAAIGMIPFGKLISRATRSRRAGKALSSIGAAAADAAARVAERVAGGLRVGRRISNRQAISRLRGGMDIHTPSKAHAKGLQKKAGHGKPMHDEAHGDGYFNHFHDNDRAGGHAFYGDPE